MSDNNFNDMESAEILRNILRSNKTISTLDLSWNTFGQTTGAIECIAVGLGSNSTLLKLDLRCCYLKDEGVFILTPALSSLNTSLQKLTLGMNDTTYTGVLVLLAEAMQQSSNNTTDFELEDNPIGNERAISLLARSLKKMRVVNNHTPFSI
jgi:Ran GTPase-activating protein (RanGAP) involved in mRNA processing and transport